jgi:8-oxo-dGTP pyrophosphatase MutT (NUDIX family)
MTVLRSLIVSTNGRILAVQREPTARNNPFKWEAPGGKREVGQKPIDALHREIGEETGLVIQPIPDVEYQDANILRGGAYDGVRRIVRVGISRRVGGLVKLSHEHEEFQWCRYREFLKLDLTPETRNAAIALRDDLHMAGVY